MVVPKRCPSKPCDKISVVTVVVVLQSINLNNNIDVEDILFTKLINIHSADIGKKQPPNTFVFM